MPLPDLEYFLVRAEEERDHAAAAANANIRSIHLDFADRYQEFAHELEFIAKAQAVLGNLEHQLQQLNGLISDAMKAPSNN